MNNHAGDGLNFDKNWRITKEARYLHWTRDEPRNQIQLAFRQHWLTFQEIIGAEVKGRRVLEVGCGRGSLSAYFSDDGWDCTLLDLSPAAIELARKAFLEQGLKGQFDVGNCMALPYADNSFDVVFSIGLLEHFEKFDSVIEEQVRVLSPGGKFIGYIVPKIPDNIQKKYQWICDILKSMVPENENNNKSEVFRSDALSAPYLEALDHLGLQNIKASGIYPLPMISHSPEFPFSLLPPEAEKVLVKHFHNLLEEQKKLHGLANPWLCDETFGQAILVWGEKKYD